MILLFFIFLSIEFTFYSKNQFLISIFSNHDGKVYWVFHKLTLSPTFWLLTLLALVICLLPDILIMVCNTYRPLKLKPKFNHSNEARVNDGFVSSTTDIPLQVLNIYFTIKYYHIILYSVILFHIRNNYTLSVEMGRTFIFNFFLSQSSTCVNF